MKRKLKKIWDGKKIEKKGDLNSPISPISKASFFGEGFKESGILSDQN